MAHSFQVINMCRTSRTTLLYLCSILTFTVQLQRNSHYTRKKNNNKKKPKEKAWVLL